ncbi:MAG: hypothetical protein M9936_16200 [Caldilinea sp.]|nr:hypothetical protein [Caldilinea sp.]
MPAAGNALDYHRYAYTRFNPMKYTDPTGHYSDQALLTHFGCESWSCVEEHFHEGGSHAGLWGWLDILLKAEDGDAVQATVSYGGMLSTVSGNFATVNGQITVQEPQLHFGKDAPSTSAGAWGEATFARMALMGSWQADHNAFYMGRHGVSVYNQQYQDCRHQDCVAQTIDTVGVAGAGLMVASPLCGPAIELCATTGGFVSLGATGVGALWTGYQAYEGKMSSADIYVTATTAAVGLTTKCPWINLAASIAQLIWDSQ